jgi:hypothetical protein
LPLNTLRNSINLYENYGPDPNNSPTNRDRRSSTCSWDQSHVGDVVYGGNDNGAIDPADKVWTRLRLWIDRNHDGVSQPDEIFTLDQLGVTSIDLGYKTLHRKDGNGNEYRYESTAMVGAKHVKAIDVYFAVAP